jgi:hypothetical protein
MKKGGFDLFLRDLFDACAPRDRFGEKNLQHRGLTTRRQLQDSCKDRDLVDGWISEQRRSSLGSVCRGGRFGLISID